MKVNLPNLSRSLEDRGPFSVEPLKPGSRSKRRALEVWNRRRVRFGLKAARDWNHAPILSEEIGKLEKNAIHTLGLVLAPSRSSGVANACAWSTPGCEPPFCLSGAGNNAWNRNALVRAARTAFLFECPATFWRAVGTELAAAIRKHGTVAARLNVLSDIRHELVCPDLGRWPGLVLIDYTKAPPRARSTAAANGWRLVHSITERHTVAQVDELLAVVPVAVVVNRSSSIKTRSSVNGSPLRNVRRVVDGDRNDERWLDRPGDLVVLKKKGKMPKLGGLTRGDLFSSLSNDA